MANSVDLNGSEYIQNIPGTYFDASAGLIGKLGDKKAGKYVSRIGLGAGTVVDLTINLAKDPDNPGKVIASTVAGDTTYYAAGVAADVLVEAAIGATLASLGIATTPVWLTIAGVGAAVGATIYAGDKAKDFIYHLVYDIMNGIENFDFYSPEIIGTVTKEEFIAQSVKNDPDFCKRMFPKYLRYRQIVEIKSNQESFLVNQIKNYAVIKTAKKNEKEAIKTVIKNAKPEKLTINNHTTKVVHPSTNLQLRNALYAIDDYQFLLNAWIADKEWIGRNQVNNTGYRRRAA